VDRNARFADATESGQRDQRNIMPLQKLMDSLDLTFPTNERRSRRGDRWGLDAVLRRNGDDVARFFAQEFWIPATWHRLAPFWNAKIEPKARNARSRSRRVQRNIRQSHGDHVEKRS
jgi:hypothetical protein